MSNILFIISDYVGITGVLFILTAYFLLSLGKLKSNDWVYQLCNFTGAWLILFSLYFHWNLSSVIIEIAWVIISITGIIRLYLNTAYKNNTNINKLNDTTS